MWAPTDWAVHRRASWLLAIVLALPLVPVATAAAHQLEAPPGVGAAAVPAPTRPNVLLIIGDDQAHSTFDRSNMPNVFSQIADKGVLFDRHYVNTSLCCPSRSSMFTGLEATDTGVSNNIDPLTRPTLIQALHDSGYRTLHAGKYLNSWPCTTTRSEFDEWYCYGHEDTQVDPTINVNGLDVPFVGYSADIFANLTSRFIATTPANQPFLAIYSPKVPHVPTDDPRHADLPIPPYHPPSYDEDTLHADKPGIYRRGPLTEREQATADANYRGMYRTTKSLDDAVGTVLSSLGSRADNTIVIYVSDNGYMFGEHRISEGKQVGYEPSVRTPMAIRDPQLRATNHPLVSEAIVQNTDIPATIAERTGIEWHAEGQSLTPIISGSAPKIRDAAVIERCLSESGHACAPDGSTRYFIGVVTDRYKYIEYFTGEVELYDLDTDPWELDNLEGSAGATAIQQQLAAQLAALRAPPAPDTNIVTGPSGTVRSVPLTFTYFSQSRASTYACRLTGPGQAGNWHSCGDQSEKIDPLPNGTFTFSVVGTDENGASDPSPATRTFTVDSAQPTVSVPNAVISEGNPGSAHNLLFLVSLNAPTNHPVQVSYETNNGTALEPADYKATSGTLTRPAGQILKLVTVPITAERSFEFDETLTLRLYGATGALLVADEAQGKIRNDDAESVLEIDDTTAPEGTGVGGTLNFPVKLTPPTGVPITVHYDTAGGTAKSDEDFAVRHDTFTIAPGQGAVSIPVPLVGDAFNEPDESMTMTLSDPTDGRIVKATATGTIDNDDAAPVMTVGDVREVEVDKGQTSTARFTVALSAPSGQKVTVKYQTIAGTATPGSDYVGATGDLTFPAGVTVRTIPITVLGDNHSEGDETFKLGLSQAKGATLGTTNATATIIDDDDPSQITVSDVTVIEDDAAAVHADFHLTLDSPATATVTVAYSTINGTAIAPGDYSPTSGVATFAPGQTDVVVSVPIIGDTIIETDETFTLHLSNPTKATLHNADGTATIVDDDARPTVSVVAGAPIVEHDSGTTDATFDIALSKTYPKAVKVDYRTVDGTAVAVGDYESTSGTLTIPAGTTHATIDVPVVGDTVYEADETFTFELDNPVDALLGVASATQKIIDDDPVPTVGITNDVVVVEGDSGTTTAVFTVVLSAVSSFTTKVKYQTGDDTAVAPGDYIAKSGQVSIPAGAINAKVAVTVVGDTVYEGNEQFVFQLTSAKNAVVNEDNYSAFGIIVDNELPPVRPARIF